MYFIPYCSFAENTFPRKYHFDVRLVCAFSLVEFRALEFVRTRKPSGFDKEVNSRYRMICELCIQTKLKKNPA